MSRPLRIEIENGVYHVTYRGWEKHVIVDDDRDREKWFELLDRVTRRFGWRFVDLALMDNHCHLFLHTPDANLSAGMHDLNSGYATCFNPKTVQRAETRCATERIWNRHIARLMKSLRTPADESVP